MELKTYEQEEHAVLLDVLVSILSDRWYSTEKDDNVGSEDALIIPEGAIWE